MLVEELVNGVKNDWHIVKPSKKSLIGPRCQYTEFPHNEVELKKFRWFLTKIKWMARSMFFYLSRFWWEKWGILWFLLWGGKVYHDGLDDEVLYLKIGNHEMKRKEVGEGIDLLDAEDQFHKRQ